MENLDTTIGNSDRYTIVDEEVVESTFSTFNFKTHYPKKNPENALHDITSGLSHIGLFDEIKRE